MSFFFITSELFGPISHKIKPEIGQYYCGMAYSGLRSNNEKRAVVLICLMFVFDLIELVMIWWSSDRYLASGSRGLGNESQFHLVDFKSLGKGSLNSLISLNCKTTPAGARSYQYLTMTLLLCMYR